MLIVAVLGVLTPLRTKAQDDITTLKLSTKLVTLAAVVRDRQGQPVRGLTGADFVLKQDGIEQDIRHFSEGSDLPLTLALMVDTSGSQRNFITDETEASKIFFPEMLTSPDDRAVLVQFDNNVLQLQKMTHSVAALEKGLDHLVEPHESVIARGAGGTMLFDAVYVTAKGVVAKETGRRAMVILTDGGDNGSRVSVEDAIAQAIKADITIYSVYYAEDSQPGSYRGQYGRDVLDHLSKSTGGEVFTVSRSMTLAQIYARIAETLRAQYTLAYRPPDSPPGTFHKLELKAHDKHLKVQSRTGYYTPR